MEEKMQIYTDDIDYFIQEYLESRNIPRDKVTSSQWAAALTYVNQRVFAGGDLLRDKQAINNEPYRIDEISRLVDLYCFLCRDYGQRISVAHFSLLTGVSKQSISTWSNSIRRPHDKKAKEIYAKLIEAEMISADDLMLSKSGVNSIAYRNATEQRYNAFKAKQQERATLDMDSLAVALGISDKLKNSNALPDKGSPASDVTEIESKRPAWMDMPDDIDLGW